MTTHTTRDPHATNDQNATGRKEYLEKLDLQIQEAKKNLVFQNAFLTHCVLIVAVVYFYFMQVFYFILLLGKKQSIERGYRRKALEKRRELNITFCVFLFDYHKDKAMRASIRFYKSAKKLIHERGY
ncbi:hypothetical protein [Helicobacter sp. T3_23-1056]